MECSHQRSFGEDESNIMKGYEIEAFSARRLVGIILHIE